jgi:anti-sigma factor RsiW
MISEEKMWEYIDGELSADEQLAMKHAIATEPNIAKLYNEMLSTHTMLKTIPAEKPSADLADRIMLSVKPMAVYQPAPKISMLPILMAVLPFAAVLILVVMVVMNENTEPSHLSSQFAGPMKILFVLADSVLLVLFIEKWLGFRKRTRIA